MKHGGDLSDAIRHHGGSIDAWLDLSTGINPWPWPIPADLPKAAWQRLPARDDQDALIAAARIAYQAPDGVAIVPGPGTQALIQWLPRLAAPGAVVIVGPTYSEHALAWANGGRDVIEIDTLERLPDSVCHAVVVSPNNPDGRIIARELLVHAAERLRERGGRLVIDASFADLDPAGVYSDLCASLPIVILRSFSKFYGLAGLRLGFAVAAAEVGASIAAALGPWAVSGPAIAIGRAALSDTDWAAQMRERLKAQARRLDEVLTKAGFLIVGGTALFRLVRHPRAMKIHESLAKQKIWARRFDWAPDLLRFGLPADDVGLQRLEAVLSANR